MTNPSFLMDHSRERSLLGLTIWTMAPPTYVLFWHPLSSGLRALFGLLAPGLPGINLPCCGSTLVCHPLIPFPLSLPRGWGTGEMNPYGRLDGPWETEIRGVTAGRPKSLPRRRARARISLKYFFRCHRQQEIAQALKPPKRIQAVTTGTPQKYGTQSVHSIIHRVIILF